MKKITIQEVKMDENLINDFISQNQWMVYDCINRYIKYSYSSILDYEDIFQLGCIGLYKAILRFDINSGNKFSTYAYYLIRGEISRFHRDHGMTLLKVGRDTKLKFIRYKQLKYEEKSDEEIIKIMNITYKELSDILNACGISYLETPINNDEGKVIYLKDAIGSYEFESDFVDNAFAEQVFKKLKENTEERDFRILMLYIDGLSQKRVAEKVGITQAQVSRIVNVILKEKIPKIISSIS